MNLLFKKISGAKEEFVIQLFFLHQIEKKLNEKEWFIFNQINNSFVQKSINIKKLESKYLSIKKEKQEIAKKKQFMQKKSFKS